MKYLLTEQELLSLLNDVIKEQKVEKPWIENLTVKEISDKLGYTIIKK